MQASPGNRVYRFNTPMSPMGVGRTSSLFRDFKHTHQQEDPAEKNSEDALDDESQHSSESVMRSSPERVSADDDVHNDEVDCEDDNHRRDKVLNDDSTQSDVPKHKLLFCEDDAHGKVLEHVFDDMPEESKVVDFHNVVLSVVLLAQITCLLYSLVIPDYVNYTIYLLLY